MGFRLNLFTAEPLSPSRREGFAPARRLLCTRFAERLESAKGSAKANGMGGNWELMSSRSTANCRNRSRCPTPFCAFIVVWKETREM